MSGRCPARRTAAAVVLAALALVAMSAPALADASGPPTVTDGNQWYNGQAAAAYATATVGESQPFDEACAWFVSQALWAGGLPEDDAWNEYDSHGQFVNVGQGSPTAADVTLLTQYILAKYPASYLEPISLTANAVPQAAVGDVIIYVWDGDPSWLYDGDHNTHTALITNIEPSGYPDVSEWGDVGESAVSPDNPWRGWTWSAVNGTWLQNVQGEEGVTAYLLHIDTSTPVTF